MGRALSTVQLGQSEVCVNVLRNWERSVSTSWKEGRWWWERGGGGGAGVRGKRVLRCKGH